eukprot:c57343_g1_i1 orf=1-156(-)
MHSFQIQICVCIIKTTKELSRGPTSERNISKDFLSVASRRASQCSTRCSKKS